MPEIISQVKVEGSFYSMGDAPIPDPAKSSEKAFSAGGAYSYFLDSDTPREWLNKVLGQQLAKDWYQATLPSGVGGLHCPYYANGVYLVATETGIIRSTDGETWTSVNSTITDITSFCYHDGVFVLTRTNEHDSSNTNGIYFSTNNGATWLPGTAATGSAYNPGYLKKVVYGNGKFVATGYRVFYSSNGQTWTSAGIPNTAENATWNDVACNSTGVWVAGSVDDDASYTHPFPGLLCSTDNGETWSPVSGEPSSYYFRHILCVEGQFIAVMDWLGSSHTDGWYMSDDGETWYQAALYADSSIQVTSPPLVLPGLVALFEGYERDSNYPSLFWGNIGLTSACRKVATSPVQSSLYYKEAKYANGVFVIPAWETAQSANKGALLSTVGLTDVNTIAADPNGYTEVCYGNGCWIALRTDDTIWFSSVTKLPGYPEV